MPIGRSRTRCAVFRLRLLTCLDSLIYSQKTEIKKGRFFLNGSRLIELGSIVQICREAGQNSAIGGNERRLCPLCDHRSTRNATLFTKVSFWEATVYRKPSGRTSVLGPPFPCQSFYFPEADPSCDTAIRHYGLFAVIRCKLFERLLRQDLAAGHQSENNHISNFSWRLPNAGHGLSELPSEPLSLSMVGWGL